MDQPDPELRARAQQPGVDERRAVVDVDPVGDTLGEGLCVDAIGSGVPVLVENVKASPRRTLRWPAFNRELDAAGIAAVFAFPLRMGVIALGSLDLYRRAPGRSSRPSWRPRCGPSIGWAPF